MKDNIANKLSASSDTYKLLTESLGVGVSRHLLDDNLTLIDADENFYHLIGYTKEEFVCCADICFSHSVEAWRKFADSFALARARGEKRTSELCRVERKGGSVIWVKAIATFTDESINGIPVIYVVTSDVTEIVQMRREREFTYKNVPGFIAKYFIGKNDIRLIDGNEKLVAFFGLNENALDEYKAFSNIADTSKPLIRKEIARMRKGQPVHFLTQVTNKHGNIAWMQVHGECIGQTGEGRLYLLIYIDITDITEQRALHKELEASAEKMRAALEIAEHANHSKSDFMARMSHDLRTPMNAIVGMATIAANNIGNGEKVEDCLNKIQISGKHLLGLINDVLDMSKIDSGRLAFAPAPLFLPDFLTNVFTIVQQMVREKGLDYSVRLHNVEHEEIIADELRLRQVFINIISNACKFTPAGGKVSINIEEIRGEGDNSEFVFTFSDSGIGMKPDFVSHVFDVFSRERDSRTDNIEGSGLGMAITKRIVELFGGDIQVKSERGKGTDFIVRLPFPTFETSCRLHAATHYRVLLLSDVEGFHAAKKTVESMGVDVESVGTVEDAVARCSEKFDLVILDWKKLGSRATETVAEIRSRLPDAVVAAAVYDRAYSEEETEAAGITAFVNKPVFASTVCNAVQRYLVAGENRQYLKPQMKFDFTGRRFLIVEDNELNREIAEELLSAENAEVVTAVNGLEGVNKFADSPVGHFDLVLMDVQMPIMNGYDATRAIRALPRPDAAKVAIVAMTADAFAEDIEKSMSAGMNGHISKPLDVACMYRTINAALASDDSKSV